MASPDLRHGWCAAIPLLAGLVLAGPGGDSASAEMLRLLSYNTHGLPAWIARDDPARRFPLIGSQTKRYDVVLLQEDFAHHARLREAARQPLVARGNPSRMPACPICTGSGLTSLVRPGRVELVRESRARPYGVCAGWLGGSNDCFATKGFLWLHLRLANGARLHVVNTHLDAGSADADREARARQLQILADALERGAGHHALVVAGDFNLDAAHPEDRALRDAFMTRLGLRDSGARPDPTTPWRVIDYILLRSGGEVELEVVEAGEDTDFVDGELPLSDHPALFVHLQVHTPADETGLSAWSTSHRPRGSPHR